MKTCPVLRVVELLTARLCHELSGPIAAIGNGIELLGEGDTEFAGEALKLVGDSARRAANRLQFYRFTYGFGFGGTAAEAAGPVPGELVTAFFEDMPIACDYRAAVRALPLDHQKLVCTLILVGADALIRGGNLAVDASGAGILLEAVGEAVAFAAEQAAALRLEPPVETLTLRTVNAYFAGLLARSMGWRLVGETAAPGRVRLFSVIAPA
ncbi:MAG TPA: histidine phosphotransferase family protein [Stellaceae bacterium]|nr:histidine phosphotransferase family protein [Stellaceae bacterium]